MAPNDLPTRERILAEAEILFAAHGFGGVSMRGVAAAAKVPLGSLPYHFGTKERLYAEIWERRMDLARADQLLDQTGALTASTREEGLRRVIEAFFAGPKAILQEDRGYHFIAIMVREAHDVTSSSRGLLDRFVYPNGARIRAALAGLFHDLPEEKFAVGFQMTISALRILLEDERQPRTQKAPAKIDVDRLFSTMSEFVVHGWMGMIS